MTGQRYQLETRDASGVFLGLTVAECVLLGAGFVATISLRLLGVPVVVSALPLVAAAGVAKIQIAGRPLHKWLPLLVAWALAGMRGRRRWRRRLPFLPAGDSATSDLPAVLQGLDVVEIPAGGRTLAAVRDRRAARLTAIVPVRAGRFSGADPATQDTLLAGWGNVLAVHAAAESSVAQVGWSHQATASTLNEHRQWLAGSNLAGGDRPTYDALVEELAEIATRHETVVWLTVSGRQVAGKGRLLDRAETALPRALETLEACLDDAGLQTGAPFDVSELWRLLRRRSDPSETTRSASGPPSLAARMGLLSVHTGPLAIDTTWSEVHIDGSWHRVYWVETWPRRPVPADWLTGFLIAESATMTVIHRPVDPARSQRRIEGQLVKLSAHRARKEDKGRRITEADERTEQAVHELEGDLASGHGEMLYLGLVCVSAPSLDELDERCHAIEQAARASQMSLRVLHGRQDVAWAATLPCGLAEPGALELVGP